MTSDMLNFFKYTRKYFRVKQNNDCFLSRSGREATGQGAGIFPHPLLTLFQRLMVSGRIKVARSRKALARATLMSMGIKQALM